MTLMSSISKLTTSVDQLTGETNLTQAQLDGKVAQADAEIVAAQAEQMATEAYRDEAAAHAATAATHLANVKAGVSYQSIGAMLAEKAVTAVDVFVYDTSLDSDGGAWRKRCQHTSWYNEPLNTATRGARREFPAVAVIIVESNKVTIYDADDPFLPLWWSVSGTTANSGRSLFYANSLDYNGGRASVVARDGKIVLGIPYPNTNGGLRVLDFVADRAERRVASPSQAYSGYLVPMTALQTAPVDGAFAGGLLNDTVNDVAIAVLPDAPRDPDTGLPMPTIAVATAAGISVIKDDGNVWDITDTSGADYSASASVVFLPSNQLRFSQQLTQSRKVSSVNIPSSDRDIYFWRTGGEGLNADDGLTLWGSQATSGSGILYGEMAHLGENAGGPARLASDGSIGTSLGLTRTHNNLANPAGSMVAYASSHYATGWLLGNITGAWLADTDSSTLTESELVANGAFDVDLDGWTATGEGTLSIVSGAMRVQNNDPFSAGSSPAGVYALNTVPGQAYTVAFEVVGTSTGNSGVGLSANPSGTTRELAEISGAGVGTYHLHFIAKTETTYLKAFSWSISAGAFADFDNFSVRLAVADRSVAKQNLIVNGSITRSFVVEGANLVAFSGFSATSYFELPFDNSLDFGTGDFCVMGWANTADPYATFVRLGDSSSGAPKIFVGTYPQPTAGNLEAYILGAPSLRPNVLTPTGWFHWALVRIDGQATLYANSVPLVNVASVADLSLAGTETLRVGVRHDGNQSLDGPGGIALLRISGNAPTPNQIVKIYEDERRLFLPGAQCTLFGTSDAVTALAHDPKTNLLHVGTSQGRSVFDGLVRVANTETPVGTAVSTVNGLVVEE
ncbi:LamG-like jellyroll fold domain-containing protein [Shimia sp. FJ5]|uniref:LamG-like jellyroll fold domain-containing protein n=1 Tax=Shimia sp. FJ5 TaxID=3079054 RepID=UPI00293DF934|nr:LamG-like jellyroll fold domain-containing protein [Shimia sp. FJ5]MDV4144372.1 LamG-like jellyroll fold domain-containing protein [Shimia sp. FJ5]